MGYYTKSYLRNRAENYSQTRKFSAVNESRNMNSFDIFLSHSYRDKDYIEGLFYELTGMGYTVYVDWLIDPNLQRVNVTKDTVNLIRERMKQSRSLVYATSENASTSKWMPWELGYMDGEKGHCAILPITDYSTQVFRGQEFLSVYPQVTKSSINSVFGGNEPRVIVEDMEYSIKNWLETNV